MQTISHVYDSYGQASAVVKDLEAAGIPSGDISMVANKYVSQRYADVDDVSATGTGAGIGAGLGGAAGLLAGLGLMAIPGLGPVVAAGWLASTAKKLSDRSRPSLASLARVNQALGNSFRQSVM